MLADGVAGRAEVGRELIELLLHRGVGLCGRGAVGRALPASLFAAACSAAAELRLGVVGVGLRVERPDAEADGGQPRGRR